MRHVLAYNLGCVASTAVHLTCVELIEAFFFTPFSANKDDSKKKKKKHTQKTEKKMEKHLNNLNSEGLKVGIIIHKGKTEYMTNHADSEDILNDQENIEKVTEFKYHGQTTHHKVTIKEKNLCQDKSSLELFWKKTRTIFIDPRQTTPHFTKKNK